MSKSTPNSNDSDDFANEMDEDDKKGKSSEFAQMLEASFKKPQRKLSVGDKIRGEILVLGKEEVFVSTGLVGSLSDGIVHRKELLNADGKIDYKVGDTIELYVVQVKGSEVRLSPKPTAKNLADDLEDAFDMMLPVEGRVAEVCKGGVRVLLQGKVAFCPISQLDLARVENAEDYVGKKLEFRITQFSEGGRNIIVSHRKFLEEQRELNAGAFAEEKREGEILTGTVKRIEPFGAFVEVAPGIEGLLHISAMSWSRISDPKEVVQVGQQVQVKILRTENKDGRLKISLSMKEAGLDPWSLAGQKFPVGTVTSGKVEKREAYGLFVKLDDGITGLLPKSKAFDVAGFGYDKLRVGDTVTVQVGELRLDERKISLQPPQSSNSEENWQGYAPQAASGSFGTLGDQMKKALEKKKK